MKLTANNGHQSYSKMRTELYYAKIPLKCLPATEGYNLTMAVLKQDLCISLLRSPCCWKRSEEESIVLMPK